ncbi:lipocalin family protein [uncultured Microscilla sp.]|uniref:lipocalin family protein n=1 Tax=uncultured Microscilla sp. TaxID=432653 RepID=UPI0026212918|nr:lipocalin family protein [uncultured Microscilla sp.]
MKLKLILTVYIAGFFMTSTQAQINKDDLIGAWHLSMEYMLKNTPAEKKKSMTAKQEMMAIVFGNVSVEFLKDGSTKIGGMMAAMAAKDKKGDAIKGSWKIEGDRLITTNDKGKEKSEKILKLTPDLLVLESKKKPGEKVYFVSLNKILKDFKNTNTAKISKKKLTGTWKAVAVESKGITMLLGIKYALKKDGTTQLKTPLDNVIEKENGTWKVNGSNKLQFTNEKKGEIKETNVTVLYFTQNQMIAQDDKKGEKILFERVK